MGKRPMLSVYILLIGSSQICSSAEGRTGSGMGSEGVAAGAEEVVHGLVEKTTCKVWNKRHLIVSSMSGQYLFACVCIRTGHDA